MKGQWLMLVMVAVLAGCSAQPDMTSFSSADWQSYGYQQGSAGKVQMSFANEILAAENVASYTQGYELGRQEYCAQDAVALGKLQRPYFGVCDELNSSFRTAYVEGTWWDDGADISD